MIHEAKQQVHDLAVFPLQLGITKLHHDRRDFGREGTASYALFRSQRVFGKRSANRLPPDPRATNVGATHKSQDAHLFIVFKARNDYSV